MKEEIYNRILQGDTELLYKTKDWNTKRIKILKRDNYECQRCLGKYKTKINIKRIRLCKANTVHHIVELKDDPTKMLDDNNLISLCRECHDIIHDRMPKAFNKPKERLTKEMW